MVNQDGTNNSKKALIAMSGGVDSSVAAKLMVDMGYDCIGCTMKLFDLGDRSADTAPVGADERIASITKGAKTCCSLEDVEDARSVAMNLGMPYYVFNFKEDFEEKIIKRFAMQYMKGMTPNPCIDCNHYMKFDKLYDRAKVLGCEYIVTGHYAIISREADGTYKLKKAADPSKDQSYVLYHLTQEQLAHTMFPLGIHKKEDTRRIAEENGFANSAKPDSQDICFAPDGDYASVVERYTEGEPVPEGNFIDENGNIYGPHKGVIHYTIGQRKGLGISSDKPLYVSRIDMSTGDITLTDNDALFKRELHAGEVNWIAGELPVEEIRCKAKIRYRHAEQWGIMKPDGEGGFFFIFDEPQRAITAGQSVVLYDGDEVLGGGTILPETIKCKGNKAMLEIKKVRSEEISELSEIATTILKEHYDPIIGPEQNDYMLVMFQSPESLAEQMEHGYRYYWAVYDGKRVGFFAIIPRDGRMYLSKLYIDKEYRGFHIGRDIIHFIAHEAGNEELRSIFLNVNKRNFDSIEAYKKIGFTIIAKEKNDIGGGFYMDDYVMEYMVK